ncbi:alpha/beta fold hydrolase, partial [bacterium]|nr:alpha/beta fold hydrolase [bacterium]
HGGPGAGFSENMRGAFNPSKFKLVMFDQRGCKRSKPEYELKDNTTQHLVEDIEKLRNHLRLEKIFLAGGSWGTTLALAYAEKYPQNVDGIVLRATFLGTREETDIAFKYGGLNRYFPEVFERVTQEVRPGSKNLDKKRLMDLIRSDDPEVSEKFSKLWSWYEIKITSLEIPDHILDDIIEKFSGAKGLALLENHYSSNDWFLKRNQLLKNADKIKDIPMTMVSGRYDMMTPPLYAYTLHKKLPKSKLWIVESAGHTDWDPNLAKKLMEAIKEFE